MNNRPVKTSYLLGSIFIFLVLFPGCTEKKEETKKIERPVPVITDKASTRKVEYILNQVGTLKASQEVTIRSEIEGRVNEILFKEGKEVKKGEVLVTLDDAKIRAEIQNLKAHINQLQIRLENKQRTLERNRPLVERNVISRQRFDDLESEINEIEAQIIQAQADLVRQKEFLSYTVIRAPFTGIAGARTFSVGHYLKVGEPVVQVIDLDPLEITFQVPEKFKTRLSTGHGVVLNLDPYPNRSFKGIVSFISPQVEVNTRAFQVKALVKNNRPLLNPGMFARVEMIIEVHENAITIPWESVIQIEGESYVYIVEEDIARKVPVRLGKITKDWAEVLDARIPEGSTLILEGKFAVKDGMKVTAQPKKPADK